MSKQDLAWIKGIEVEDTLQWSKSLDRPNYEDAQNKKKSTKPKKRTNDWPMTEMGKVPKLSQSPKKLS